MAQVKTIYVCQQCGHSTSGWMGKCPSCGGWGSFVEEISDASGKKKEAAKGALLIDSKAYRLDEIDANNTEERYPTGILEFDRVLGGGLVKGSMVLVGGDPGIGKSTLLLQMCEAISAHGTVLYVSGEESTRQIKMRADRLGVKTPGLAAATENKLAGLEKLIADTDPKVVIVDSIQTMYNDELNTVPGSVGQIREVTMQLMRLAKSTGISFFIVGHVTKEGTIAGPKVLEHMVDTVLYFEGERNAEFRILRAVKNRFGSTNEIGVFEMSDHGLMEVENPSAVILSERPRSVPGSVVVPSIEGTRPVLVEIQALATRTAAQNPRRVATGIDFNRLTLMTAILEKRLGLKLYDCDVYVNVTGGLRISEPACDLGIIAAITSSFRDRAFDPDTALIGEVGLTGEVRSVNQIEKRLTEVQRLGFLRCVVPEGNLGSKEKELRKMAAGLEIYPVRHIVKAFDLFV